MTNDKAQTARLTAEIELKRAALAELRAELAKLHEEVAIFARLYDKVVGPLESQLDAIRQEIEMLQNFRPAVPPPATDSIWGPYGSFEESFDAKYRNRSAIGEDNKPARKIVDDTSLKALYRKLARRYHPDMTSDPAEKVRFTVLMAQINAAYRAKNIDELRAIDGQPTKKAKSTMPDVSVFGPQEPSYLDLIKLSQKLDDEIEQIKIERQQTLTSPLMQLKIEYSLARSRGRDLLKEIGTKIRSDINVARQELDQLRRTQ